MAMTMAAALKAAESLIYQKRFRSAREMLQRMHEGSQRPVSKTITGYQCGALSWTEIGDGEAARRYFKSTADLCRGDPQLAQHLDCLQLWANSCENLMLLSLSHDEYEQWAEQLAKLQPDNPILQDHRPKFRNLVENGHPWADALQIMATSFYNRNDPKFDARQYGCAASIWQVILKNRKPLRLNRDDWRIAVFEHAVLTKRIALHAGQAMEQLTHRPAEVEEFLFITDATVPFLEEYLAGNPTDAVVLKLREEVREFFSVMRDPVPAEYSKPIPGEGPVKPPGALTTRHICERCRRVLGEVTLMGGDLGMHARLDALTGNDMGMCPHCGGQVRAVSDGESAMSGPGGGQLPLGCWAVAVLFCSGLGWVIGMLTNKPDAWKGGLGVGLFVGGISWAVISLLNLKQRK